MEAKFSYEKSSFRKLGIFFSISMLICPMLLVYKIDARFVGVAFIILCLYFVIKRYNLDGIIVWEQDGIVICRMKGEKAVPRWAYTLDEIESVSCTSEITHTRFEIIHLLVFNVVLTSGKKRNFCFELDIDENSPVQQPEKFKEYIDEQPLMQLCKYINERLGNSE